MLKMMLFDPPVEGEEGASPGAPPATIEPDTGEDEIEIKLMSGYLKTPEEDLFGQLDDVEVDELDLDGGAEAEPEPVPEPAGSPPAAAVKKPKGRPKKFQTTEAPVSDFLVRDEAEEDDGEKYECYMCHGSFSEADLEGGRIKKIKDSFYCTSCIQGV